MKKLMFVLTGLLCLSGCSSSASSLTCKIDNEVIQIENIYTYENKENGKLMTQTTNTTTDLSAAGDDKEKIYSALEKVKEAYNGIEGIDYTYSEEGSSIIETTKVDFQKIDPANLSSLKIEANGEDVFELESFKQNLIDSGFTCE